MGPISDDAESIERRCVLTRRVPVRTAAGRDLADRLPNPPDTVIEVPGVTGSMARIAPSMYRASS